MTEITGRPLRADAERNRRRILAAATRLVPRVGLEVSFDDIAREAGVGVGTVYRRFPDRESLFVAVFEDHLATMLRLLDDAVAADDATAGLRRFLEAMVEHHVADRALKELVFSQAECAERMIGTRDRVLPAFAGLVERAVEQGGLREGVAVSDLMLAVLMCSTAGELTESTHPEQWRRQFAVVWDGLSARPHRGGIPGAGLGFDELNEAFNQGGTIRRGAQL